MRREEGGHPAVSMPHLLPPSDNSLVSLEVVGSRTVFLKLKKNKINLNTHIKKNELMIWGWRNRQLNPVSHQE